MGIGNVLKSTFRGINNHDYNNDGKVGGFERARSWGKALFNPDPITGFAGLYQDYKRGYAMQPKPIPTAGNLNTVGGWPTSQPIGTGTTSGFQPSGWGLSTPQKTGATTPGDLQNNFQAPQNGLSGLGGSSNWGLSKPQKSGSTSAYDFQNGNFGFQNTGINSAGGWADNPVNGFPAYEQGNISPSNGGAWNFGQQPTIGGQVLNFNGIQPQQNALQGLTKNQNFNNMYQQATSGGQSQNPFNAPTQHEKFTHGLDMAVFNNMYPDNPALAAQAYEDAKFNEEMLQQLQGKAV